MKRWALVVAALYALLLVFAVVPAIIAVTGYKGYTVSEYLEEYHSWGMWFYPAIFLLSQLLLLVMPVRVAGGRPLTRSTLWPTLIAAGLMTGFLVLGAIWSLGEFFFSDRSYAWNILNPVSLALGIVSWCVWSIVFYRMSRRVPPRDLITRQCRALFAGSVLELLIAVPTHVVVRQRPYCCAGAATGVGLAAGIAVMLFSYGPAVIFLIAERWLKLQPKPPASQSDRGAAPPAHTGA
jgi:hypothetical protein